MFSQGFSWVRAPGIYASSFCFNLLAASALFHISYTPKPTYLQIYCVSFCFILIFFLLHHWKLRHGLQKQDYYLSTTCFAIYDSALCLFIMSCLLSTDYGLLFMTHLNGQCTTGVHDIVCLLSVSIHAILSVFICLLCLYKKSCIFGSSNLKWICLYSFVHYNLIFPI